MKIVTTSEYEIFDEYAFHGELIKKSAQTCYASELRSNKSTEQLIELLKNNKHFAMLEFAWYPVLLKPLTQGSRIFEDVNLILKRFIPEKYLNCSVLEDGTGVIISGNGRAWYECLIKDKTTNVVSRSIYNLLNKVNPSLFDTNDNFSDPNLWLQLLLKEQVQLKEKTLNELPLMAKQSERDIHDWLAVKFYGVSQGLTHELIRHRVMSFAIHSNRFVPMKDFNCMFGDSPITKNIVEHQKIEDCLKLVQETYNYLINRGQKRDIARQILPIGITGDVVVGGNIQGWKHLFELQTNVRAHWEISTIINDLKGELNEKYNYEF